MTDRVVLFIGAMPLYIIDVKRDSNRRFKSGWVLNGDWYLFVDRNNLLVSKTSRGKGGRVLSRQIINWSRVTEVVVPEEVNGDCRHIIWWISEQVKNNAIPVITYEGK